MEGGSATPVDEACSVFAGAGTDEVQDDEAVMVAAKRSRVQAANMAGGGKYLLPILSG